MKLPSQIGHYIVEREIGRGGMGVVYSGRDTRLDRPVAVKALPVELGADANRLARLEREARVLASLSHPNIAALYGLEEQGGAKYLVMEMIEGETLADRLRRGPLPVDEAVQVCAHIAEGLEAAHDAGVIHRDLKPGNVKVLPDGRVKILDFGLAKESVVRPSSSLDVTSSPTAAFSAPATVAGQIMGTPGYLSPEQARGKPLDKRTDIWSFGCVLYECLTGQMCFGGETVSDTIAAVLERDPDLRRLPDRTPQRVRDLIARCLEKQAKNRLRDIGDARIELAQAMATRAWSTTAIAQAAPARGRGLLWALVGFAMLLAVAMLFRTPLGRAVSAALRPSPAAPVTRLTLNLATPMWFERAPSISPDGSVFAYISEPETSGSEPARARAFLRRMDSFEAVAVPGSEGAHGGPSFSPDGRWIAVCRSNAEGTRHMIAKARVGPEPEPMITLYESTEVRLRRPVWLSNDTLLFTSDGAMKIWTMRADGSEARAVIHIPDESGGIGVEALCPLGNEDAALATLSISEAKGFHLDTVVLDLKAGTMRPLLSNAAFARPLPTGHLLYSNGDTLFAAPFDASRLEVTGPGVQALAGVRSQHGYPAHAFDVSREGRLVYIAKSGGATGRRLMRADREGVATPLASMEAIFEDSARLSYDGTMVSGTVVEENGSYGLYVYTIATDSLRRLPVTGWEGFNPIWTRDSQQVIHNVAVSGRPSRVVIRRADGSDSPTLILEEADETTFSTPECVLADGKTLLITRLKRGSTTEDYVLVDMTDPSRITRLMTVPSANTTVWARLSGDGKYLAYTSEESGRGEVYLRRAPNPDGTWPDESRVLVSTAGGTVPRWASESGELFYLDRSGILWVTRVLEGTALAVAPPERIVSRRALGAQTGLDPSPDGKTFVFAQFAEDERHVTQVSVVENWFQELRAKLDAAESK